MASDDDLKAIDDFMKHASSAMMIAIREKWRGKGGLPFMMWQSLAHAIDCATEWEKNLKDAIERIGNA